MRNNHKLVLIHAVRAIQYRFQKVTNGSAENFGDFTISPDTRTPSQIIHHMYDLTLKTKTMILEGHFKVPQPILLNFPQECERLVTGLMELQTVMNTCYIDIDTCEKLMQGPILDIATHIGQIAMLNGLNGHKIPRESYYDAEI